MYFSRPLLILMMLITVSCSTENAVSEYQLKDYWEFRKAGDVKWDSATVPGTVHTDLLALKKIEDPFYRLNEHALQWIDKEDWEYKIFFGVDKETLSRDNVVMEFSGIDTYGKIYINDSLVGETDNMFRTYTFDVKKHLWLEPNELKIVLESPIRRGIDKHDAIDFTIPVSGNDLSEIGQVDGNKKVSVFTRKAGYHFGWDWGPRLVTSGIWRPVTLRSWDNHQITDVFVRQDRLDSTATLTAITEIDFSGATPSSSTVEVLVNGKVAKTEEVKLSSGQNKVSLTFDMDSPELWWPNGMGEQTMYDVTVKVTSEGYADEMTRRIGLRNIELVREPDAIGTSFYFKVNGHPVFMKGANYIPQDVFLTRPDKADYKHILSSVKAANMNMIRVWGGGIYENDEFYELCDEMGLLVWQDFMFACAMFPGDKAFLDNVRQEAIDNVIRLRNHPSIALWCGNNENLSAWENWGWKKEAIETQGQAVADTIWKAYDDVFHKILPEVVAQYDNSRSYWPSSPGSDFGKTENLTSGDAHYWMVWWGKLPFDSYNEAIPRFMSEYGFQSFPAMSTVSKYTAPEDHDVYSEVMKSHQRSSIGNVTIEEYMQRHYKVPTDFKSFLYVSQLLQSHGIKIGIEAHRKNRDRCMGSLYWQVNDCWPVASWSGIDYFGKWKAMHYMARESFKTYMIGFDQQEDIVRIRIVSDSLKSIDAKLELQLLGFDGTVIENWEESFIVPANQVSHNFTKPIAELLQNRDPSAMMLVGTLKTEDQILATNIHYFRPFKDLNLPQPDLSYEVAATEDGFAVTLKTQALAKDVYLATGTSQNFSNNYFDLLPGEETTVTIDKGDFADVAAFKSALKVMTLRDTYVENGSAE